MRVREHCRRSWFSHGSHSRGCGALLNIQCRNKMAVERPTRNLGGQAPPRLNPVVHAALVSDTDCNWPRLDAIASARRFALYSVSFLVLSPFCRLWSIESRRSDVAAFWIASSIAFVSFSPVRFPDSLNSAIFPVSAVASMSGF
jgi:hypothetical protein